MEVKIEETLADLSARGEDTSKSKQFLSLFEQSVSFLCQELNSIATSYCRRKSILIILIDGKIKVIIRLIKPTSICLGHISKFNSLNQSTSSKNQSLCLQD